MNELSLFSGAGGGLLGTLLLGFRPIGYVEYDDYCQRVIAQRIADGILPNAPIFGDVRAFIGEGYAAAYTGLVDVLSGGFPCQPFSVAGKRAAAEDDRNMWPATIEVIRIVRPALVFLENVPGLLSTGYAFTIIDDLQRADYQVLPPAIVGADDVGAPHKRERLWLCAYSDSTEWRPPSQVEQLNTRWQHAATEGWQQSADGLGDSRSHVPNAARQQDRRLQQREIPSHVGAGGKQLADAASERCSWASDSTEQARWPGTEPVTWWQAEPELGRLADGIPRRVDRLKAAGNGQVPAVVRAAWHLLTEDLAIEKASINAGPVTSL